MSNLTPLYHWTQHQEEQRQIDPNYQPPTMGLVANTTTSDEIKKSLINGEEEMPASTNRTMKENNQTLLPFLSEIEKSLAPTSFPQEKPTPVGRKNKMKTRAIGKTISVGETLYTKAGDEAVATIQQKVQMETATFTKVFAAALPVAYDLTTTEHRLLWVLLTLSQISPGQFRTVLTVDRINLLVQYCSLATQCEFKPFAKSSFFRARAKLVEKGIIIPSSSIRDVYIIHPDFAFNGNRLRIQVDFEALPALAPDLAEISQKMKMDPRLLFDN